MKDTPVINKYDQQAMDFLAKFNLGVEILLSDTKEWAWGGGVDKYHHHHYRVAVFRIDNFTRRLSFDFWGSVVDWEQSKDPSVYAVLAGISCSQYLDSFREIVSQFGEDGIRGLDLDKMVRFAAEMKAFFTEEELNDLDEIR